MIGAYLNKLVKMFWYVWMPVHSSKRVYSVVIYPCVNARANVRICMMCLYRHVHIGTTSRYIQNYRNKKYLLLDNNTLNSTLCNQGNKTKCCSLSLEIHARQIHRYIRRSMWNIT